MQVGDKVRLIGIPPNVKDNEEFRTRTLFENCLDKTFTVKGFQNVEDLPYPLIQLDVGHIVGREDNMESIYVEPEYLQVVSADSQ